MGKVIVIKGTKTSSNEIKLCLYSDIIEAKYSPPQIQSNYSNSGPTFTSRPLDVNETASLTNAVKNKAI